MNFESLPEKNNYQFKEITSLTGVKPYVLRFWESEFDQIKPDLGENGDKLYSRRDLSCVTKIRDLLFQDKLSIAQAKVYLDKELKQEEESMRKEMMSKEIHKKIYTGVETRAAIGELIMARTNGSMNDLQESLKQDLEQQKELVAKKQFNDQDVLRLVQTKKKLTGVLSRIDEIIERKNW